jgi:hypothetical protein
MRLKLLSLPCWAATGLLIATQASAQAPATAPVSPTPASPTCGPYGATHRSRARDSGSTCAGSGAVTCPAGCGYASIRPGAASPHAP